MPPLGSSRVAAIPRPLACYSGFGGQRPLIVTTRLEPSGGGGKKTRFALGIEADTGHVAKACAV